MNRLVLNFSLFWLLLSVHLPAQQFLDQTINYAGELREYKLYLPINYDGSTPLPLVFNFHGGGGDIASQIAIADMRPIADTADFIIVYPQALPDPNDGGSTNWLHKDPTNVDDVFFVDAMIDAIDLSYAIDLQRIYACGYSLGGEFTYELACRLNDRIAAIGVVARTMGTAAFNQCAPSHPTGILTILGTDDQISPYEGLTFNGIQYYLSADEMHDYWASYNNTDNQPSVVQLPNTNSSDGSQVECYTWENGDNCSTVKHLKVIGGGHDWPGSFGNMDIDASVEIWNYVSKFDLNGLINCSTNSIFTSLIPNYTILYPNPVYDQIVIDQRTDQGSFFKIYSLDGTCVQTGILPTGNDVLELSHLPTGTYFISIGNSSMKFVKL